MIIYALPSSFNLDDTWSQPVVSKRASIYVAQIGSRSIEIQAETEELAIRELVRMGYTKFTNLRRK